MKCCDVLRICGDCNNALFEKVHKLSFLVTGILLKTGSDWLKYTCRVLTSFVFLRGHVISSIILCSRSRYHLLTRFSVIFITN